MKQARNQLKSHIKALSNCYYNLYSYSRAELNDADEWFDHGYMKVSSNQTVHGIDWNSFYRKGFTACKYISFQESLFLAVKYGCNAIEVGHDAQTESWIDENCSKIYQRVMEIQDRIFIYLSHRWRG